MGGVEWVLVVWFFLESLLVVGSYMLREVLDGFVVDLFKNLWFLWELKFNKKYSWMCKKEEWMYVMKFFLEDMDVLELDFWMWLVEV